jgi:Acyl-CoA dehydrogenase, C-terminal domain
MNEQVAAFAELTTELLAAGKVDDLVEQLSDPDLAEEWEDPAMVAAVGEAYGRAAAGGRLLDVAVLRRHDVSLLMPVTGQELATTATRVGDEVEIAGMVRGPLAGTLAFVVDGKVRLTPTDALEAVPVTGLDPTAALHLVRGRLAEVPAELFGTDADAVVSRAARFLAHELVGTAEGALNLALAHVRSRHQFGVPIGSFQALQQPLADAVMAADGALLVAREAAWRHDSGLDAWPAAAAVAFAHAAEAAVRCAELCLHVHGGYGYTLEYDAQLYLRRAKATRLGAGDPDLLWEQIGATAIGKGAS